MFENLFSPYENFKFRDSSSTEAAFGDGPTVALTSSPLTHWELITVESRLLGLLHWILSAHITLTGRCAGTVSAVCCQAAATHSPYAVSPDDVLGQTSYHCWGSVL